MLGTTSLPFASYSTPRLFISKILHSVLTRLALAKAQVSFSVNLCYSRMTSPELVIQRFGWLSLLDKSVNMCKDGWNVHIASTRSEVQILASFCGT